MKILKYILISFLFLQVGLVKAVEGPVKKFISKEKELIYLIVTSATQKGVDPYKALALVKVESSLNPEAQRYEPKFKSWSIGLFQMFLPTARAMGFKGTIKQLKNPVVNTNLGLEHIKTCMEEVGEDMQQIACCHKAGFAVEKSVCKNNLSVKEYIKDVNTAYLYWKKNLDASSI